jgi:hypothetical protein
MTIEKSTRPLKKSTGTRKATRFRDEDTMNAVINGTRPALAFSESRTGCGLVLISGKNPKVGDEITVKLGTMAPLAGIVRWVDSLDKDVIKIGVEYSE